MEKRVFLDSAYAIALASRADEYHATAVGLSRIITQQRIELVTTRAICYEIGNALAKLRFRPVAVQFLENLASSAEAFDLYRSRRDKVESDGLHVICCDAATGDHGGADLR
jgi:predicted nucleic acid-binding protein